MIYEHLGDALVKNGLDEDALAAWEKALSSTRPPTGSRRRSMTSRIASAGSRVARRPLSSLLLCLQVALLAACATAPPREPISDDARRALALLAERYAEFTTMRALPTSR